MSDVFQWDDSYSVGVEQIDDDHKQLITLGNDMIKAAVANKGADIVGEVLNELIEYTEGHFGREEELMVKTNYPEYRDHRVKHKRLMNDVFLFKSQYIAGNVEPSAISRFLIDWIVKHILEEDKEYAEHFHAHGLQ